MHSCHMLSMCWLVYSLFFLTLAVLRTPWRSRSFSLAPSVSLELGISATVERLLRVTVGGLVNRAS